MKNKINFGLIAFLIASYVGPVQAASLADVISIEAYNQCELSGSPNCSTNIGLPLMDAMYSGCYIEIEIQFEDQGCQNAVTNLCQSLVQRALICLSNQFRKTEGY
jgi:hypothetical protein